MDGRNSSRTEGSATRQLAVSHTLGPARPRQQRFTLLGYLGSGPYPTPSGDAPTPIFRTSFRSTRSTTPTAESSASVTNAVFQSAAIVTPRGELSPSSFHDTFRVATSIT